MKLLKILISCAFCLLVNYVAKAQDLVKQMEDKDSQRDTKAYVINSLEGKKCVIHILPHYPLHNLKIRYQKDTITISDYWGVPADIRVLGKSFLEIDYAIRGGSGVGLGNTLIFCVSHDHLCKCMYVMKYLNGEGGGEQDDYHINISLTGNSIRTYKLYVKIKDKVSAKSDPEQNYDYQNLSVLSFDTKNDVFYSVKQGLYDVYEIENEKGKTGKQKLHGYYPEIILGKETYYYINNSWYSLSDGKELSKVMRDDD